MAVAKPIVPVVATATVDRGVTTNRVRVGKRAYSVREPKTYYKDMSTRGRGYTVFAVSFPPDALAALDAFADENRMARSHVIREAVAMLIAQRATPEKEPK